MRLFSDKRNVWEYLIRTSVYMRRSGGDRGERFSQFWENGRSLKNTQKTDNKMVIVGSGWKVESYGQVYQFSFYLKLHQPSRWRLNDWLLTGNRTASTSETIPTEAEIWIYVRLGRVARQISRVHLLVNKLDSTVNLTILTRTWLLKRPSFSLLFLVSCGVPEQSQLSERSMKANTE